MALRMRFRKTWRSCWLSPCTRGRLPVVLNSILMPESLIWLPARAMVSCNRWGRSRGSSWEPLSRAKSNRLLMIFLARSASLTTSSTISRRSSSLRSS